MTDVRTDLKTWLQLLPYGQLMPAERPPQYFVVAVFVSLIIHVSLGCILWNVVSGSTAVEPRDPTINTPLILSLSTFTTASHDKTDLEVVPAEPQKDPPTQSSHSSPEASPGAERKSEADTVVISKDQGAPDSEAPGDKSLETFATPSFDLYAAYRQAWDFESMPELKTETFDTLKGRVIPGSETAGDKSFPNVATPLFGLEAVSFMEREFGRMPESKIQDIMTKSRMVYIKDYIIEYNRDPQRDCRTAYAGKGLLAFPYLLRDAITGDGCKWRPVLEMGGQQSHMTMINRPAADTYKTLLPFKMYDRKVIFNITEEGGICIKGIKLDLSAIQGIMEIFKDEYPDGRVIITYDKDSLYKTALEVFDKVRAAGVKTVVMAQQ